MSRTPFRLFYTDSGGSKHGVYLSHEPSASGTKFCVNEYKVPLVSTSDARASRIRVKVGNTTYAVKKYYNGNDVAINSASLSSVSYGDWNYFGYGGYYNYGAYRTFTANLSSVVRNANSPDYNETAKLDYLYAESNYSYYGGGYNACSNVYAYGTTYHYYSVSSTSPSLSVSVHSNSPSTWYTYSGGHEDNYHGSITITARSYNGVGSTSDSIAISTASLIIAAES